MISSGQFRVSGEPVMLLLSKHNFDAIVAMGLVGFELTHSVPEKLS